MSAVMREAENHVPASARDSWRNWLMTGTRRGPIYRRRVRGAHEGLKRMLVEGMSEAGDQPRPWKNFSGAMVRQAVDEAVSTLPPRQKQLIKLAYFSDQTNREIAQGLGITLSSVERGLREAISRVSEYVERGKGVGRRAIYAIGLFLAGRQLIKAGVIIVATTAAGAVVSAQPAAPSPVAPAERASVPSVTSMQPYVVLQRHVLDTVQGISAVAHQATSQSVGAGGVRVTTPTVALPAVDLPLPVTVPPLPVKVPPLPPIRLPQGLFGA
jgi:RNA polymerase sigma factor (sigma-70 family)